MNLGIDFVVEHDLKRLFRDRLENPHLPENEDEFFNLVPHELLAGLDTSQKQRAPPGEIQPVEA